MRPDERQAAIWDIVFQRNYETVPNLACELGVSTRTIYEDLSRMKGKYSIITMPGRYGGVYITYEPRSRHRYLTPTQEMTLRKIIPLQPMETQQILQSILDVFARKHS